MSGNSQVTLVPESILWSLYHNDRAEATFVGLKLNMVSESIILDMTLFGCKSTFLQVKPSFKKSVSHSLLLLFTVLPFFYW